MGVKKQTLNEVVFIRAIAAVGVVCFHLYVGNKNLFPMDHFLKNVFSFGFLGVELFFLLSGYIICYSLPKAYSIKQDGLSFLKKRFLRIEPPYLLSILACILINIAASYFSAAHYNLSMVNILLHFAYLNNFGLGDYINVVYWTLGIEFQFYIIIFLIFQLLNQPQKIRLFLSLALLLLTSFIKIEGMRLIFEFLPIFVCGILTYFYKIRKRLTINEYLVALLVSFIFVYIQQPLLSFTATIIGVMILMFFHYSNAITLFFSKISFSLYLTHVFVGGKVINLGLRFVSTFTERFFLFVLALLASVLFAWLFYWLIEKPAILWSKRLKYTNS